MSTLQELGNWCSCNKQSLSPTKCKYALINKQLKTELNQTTLRFYGKNLSEIRANSDTTSNPFVGYKLSEKLDSKDHIAHIQKKIRSGIYALRQNKSLPEFSKKIFTLHSFIHTSNFCVESGLFCMGVWPVLQRTVKQLIHFSMGKKVVFKILIIAHKSQNLQWKFLKKLYQNSRGAGLPKDDTCTNYKKIFHLLYRPFATKKHTLTTIIPYII